ncbi:MAG: hypothetical protein ISS13_03550 [Actinobacteria bacterium]|nr:hypothetical protein [Actinomycetota bacterium]MBL7060894.1 hypothetical protein [Actinomycetota bacterium]
MKSLRKILISSAVLITVGILGLIATLFAGNLYTGLSNFGTGRGYAFNPEDISSMCKGFLKNQEIVNIDFEKVENLASKYLERNNLSNLEIVEIMEFSQNFYIEVEEKDTGIGAMELLVDKSSGAIFPEYGPNVMWNLKYGMHSKIPLSQGKIDMPIGESKAIELAERYLAKINLNEYAGDEAEKFYGYYTIHTLTDGDVITGMLSVNGYNGQVWYHNWHGVFIDMIEKH